MEEITAKIEETKKEIEEEKKRLDENEKHSKQEGSFIKDHHGAFSGKAFITFKKVKTQTFITIG